MCRLPGDKVVALQADIWQVLSKDKATLATIQSLLDRLNFAARIIPAGRIFARRLARATAKVNKSHHLVRLSLGLKEDLRMWLSFLEEFKDTQLWRTPWCTSQQLQLFTDASGREGFGAILDRQWCAGKWPNAWGRHGLTKNITVLEMFPIVLSLHLWPQVLADKRITFWSDNMAVVQANCPVLVGLLRELVRVCLLRNVEFRAWHVQGVKNVAADALFRFQWTKFRPACPQAMEEMTPFRAEWWRLVQWSKG
ncbi:hypothetical protein NDU88_002307 [Pleurodeles waltl]|uniref:Uncharacterized protein n=1 Tax=Pleurodeles waltl TaxID=8319 RepID=A0AAV7U940_PLEWA|nr:hypothetical protein NDU88_002307 [Pleurodeles waltl]